MADFTLEAIHSMLEKLDVAQRQLNAMRRTTIQATDVPDLLDVILDITGGYSASQVKHNTGINDSLLNKFAKLRGSVSTHQARKVVARLQTFLKSQDQKTDRRYSQKPVTEKPKNKKTSNTSKSVSRDADAQVTVVAQQWVQIRRTPEISKKIAEVARLLDEIIVRVSRENAPPSEQALSEIEKNQLIAILETALQILKSPMVEKGLLRKLSGMLKRSAGKAAEKGTQDSLGKLFENGGAKLLELINQIF